MRRYHVTACLVLCSLWGCGETGSGGQAGGTIVIASPGNAAPVLPPLVNDNVGRAIADQVYDRLAEIGADLNTRGDAGFTPRLSRSWTWSADSLSIAFAIDPDARWHDGRPVRASDVRFTLGLIRDPASASPLAAYLSNVDSITVSDSLTAVAWFARRTPEQFYYLVYQMHVLPEHVLREVPRQQLASADVNNLMVGSGRFKLARFEPGVRIELVADTANYRGRPRLDRVVWSITSDAQSAIAQLFSGQADIFENLPADLVGRADSSGTVRAFPYPGLGYTFLAMNTRDRRRASAPHPVLGDKRVRRAISMALDRRSLLRNVFDTLGILAAGPYPRALADTTISPPLFDRARAEALLDSAGWRTQAGGVRMKDGKPLSFSLLAPTSSAPRMRYAVLIQEQLASVGARVNVETMDIRTFIDRQGNRNFDAALLAWGPDPNLGGVSQNWVTSSIVPGGVNWVSYSNPAFDAAIDSASNSFDPTTSRMYARRAFQILVDDAPAVWLYDILNLLGLHRRIRPEGVRADGWWSGLADWWIPADQRIERDRIGLRPAQP